MGLRGPKKGAKYAPTIAKEQAREALRTIVLERMREMTEAQIASACGVKYLVSRDKKTGKFVTLSATDKRLQAGYEDEEREVVEVWQEKPSTPAFTDLMNRAIDKPVEQVQMEHSGEVTLLDARIKAARERVRKG